MTVNKVILVGYMGDDVKIHRFEGGDCVGRVSIATSESYINKQTNERMSVTEWHALVFRNKAAETVEKYCHKGDRIYVEGKIKTRSYTAESGETKYVKEIQVTEFNFMTTKDESSSQQSGPAPQSQQQAPPLQEYNKEDHDDLPF